MHTTPSIATILTDLHPVNNKAFETQDTYKSEGISVIELTSKNRTLQLCIFGFWIDFFTAMETQKHLLKYSPRVQRTSQPVQKMLE